MSKGPNRAVRGAASCGIWIAAQRGPSLTRFNRAWRRRSLTSGAGRPRAAPKHGGRSTPFPKARAMSPGGCLRPAGKKCEWPVFVRLHLFLATPVCTHTKHRTSRVFAE
ncbi:hypothetical protein MRX96_009947 [Rhipicephalus microplus]